MEDVRETSFCPAELSPFSASEASSELIKSWESMKKCVARCLALLQKRNEEGLCTRESLGAETMLCSLLEVMKADRMFPDTNGKTVEEMRGRDESFWGAAIAHAARCCYYLSALKEANEKTREFLTSAVQKLEASQDIL